VCTPLYQLPFQKTALSDSHSIQPQTYQFFSNPPPQKQIDTEPKNQKEEPVTEHSEHYLLAKETIALDGQPLHQRSYWDALRRAYTHWIDCYTTVISFVR